MTKNTSQQIWKNDVVAGPGSNQAVGGRHAASVRGGTFHVTMPSYATETVPTSDTVVVFFHFTMVWFGKKARMYEGIFK
jgi:hypothetical protein